MQPLDDTIAAIATAPGTAGLAVVRVSGGEALQVADAMFRAGASVASAEHGALTAAAGHTLHHGWAIDPAAATHVLDEVVAAVFRAPRSYTGEDTVEFSCHGGAVPAKRVLAALLAAGARLAGPGEFTLRAFLRGRIDLAQAEAVADLVHAETESAGDLALAQLSGALSVRLSAITERITDAAAEVEARVDFAEDVGGIETPAHVRAAITSTLVELDALLAGAPWARAVREGVRVPMVGRPNAGKSSLFNALLGEERAIVTPEPGTTRDRVSERLEIAGVAVTLSDTAGIRLASNPIEAMGVARALGALEDAALVLWVVDGTQPYESDGDLLLGALAGKRVLLALTKSDLIEASRAPVTGDELLALIPGGETHALRVSSVTGDGLTGLRDAFATLLGAGEGAAGGLAGAVANPRHSEALSRARAALARADEQAALGAPGEIVALELREALAAVGEVTGQGAGADLLDRIFARFCIGK